MDSKVLFLIFAMCFVASQGFGIREIWDFLIGGYGQHYPGYPGQYPGNYPGQGGYYPSGGYPGPVGPPGAHPGCPLCDSSVYSYCSYKQAHDACCCEGYSFPHYGCRKTDCRNLFANSCQEYQLISECCCVDVQKNNQPQLVV
ncbi:hypothetical protein K1T71_010981 [Dendrolimus kikuchii]|uniref:Uncharacterized protein n=1 Tax=Dendrolimus kikuchii TaxID=765133 RepID=A0ACC1CRE6_9NEOP|nr:hypothetical protein K1T71_010981 [Dendrolimus kikuchii]